MSVIFEQLGFDITDGAETPILVPFDHVGAHLDKVRVLVEVGDAPSGTLPTLDFAVGWSAKGEQYAVFAAESGLTQQTAQGAEVNDLTVAGRLLKLTPTIGGTPATPTLTVTETTTGVVGVAAQGTLTMPTIPADGDTMTVDGKVYTFQTVLTNGDGNVAIGGTLAQAKLNIVAAFDLSGTPGVDYASATLAHPSVDIAAFIVNDAVLTAKVEGTAGNSIGTTETFTPVGNIFDAATLGTTTAGVNPVNQVETIDVGVADSGTFTLTVDAQTTAVIAWDASAADIKAALELLSTVTTVAVTGVGSSGDPWVVTFTPDEPLTVTGDGALLTELDLFTNVSVVVVG
jgi:hypothetical protein